MLRFDEKTQKAHFIVSETDIQEANYPYHESYEDSHPILRVLKPYLFEYFPGAINITLDSNLGLVDKVRLSGEVEVWLAAAQRGECHVPVQFAITRHRDNTGTITLDWTGDFIVENFSTRFYETVESLADEIALSVDCVYHLLDDCRDPRVIVLPVPEEEYDEEEYYDCYDESVYKTLLTPAS